MNVPSGLNLSVKTDERLCQDHYENMVIIHQPFDCDYGKQISVGRSFFANFHFIVLDEAKVTIGDDWADAVVGIAEDYEVLGEGGGMLMVTASGTAVKLDY